ncbi:hypothetical protein KC726_05505 [Candidatus Woesebacteria bacterium]|nr:hypothetical protein [Candidatus Woesebacteria bacterium]
MEFEDIIKRIKKIPKKPHKYSRKAWEEFLEEAEDFLEDFDIFHKTPLRLKEINYFGAKILVRPAYIFAERIENLLKIVVGFSIVVSAIMSVFWGFTKTSELFAVLITTVPGRIIMIFIGLSYFVVGLWKFFNLHKQSRL